ncbi:NADPH-dependent FMN reductase [Negadavirga shengliensis]|uniref:NADPH-dependent FMN reductase n=1 Tax=Negadavirga shengliensis TaxID=1389218 RepID=A0ABV9T3Z2_9BACT
MKIAILNGSIRPERQSVKVAWYLEKQLRDRGLDVDLIDLAEYPLPMYGASDGLSKVYEDNVDLVAARLKAADAMIFVTPEYHGTFSGVLKNALDYYWEEFSKKPIGVATASAGKMGGINASTQLQHLILSLGAYALPVKFLVSGIQTAFNESNEPVEKAVQQSAKRFLDEFIWLSEAVFLKKTNPECVPA